MADPKEKKLLERIAKLTEENNRLLRKMRTSQVIGRVMTIVYWLIILGVGVGLYHVIQPYLQSLLDAYSSVQGSLDSVQNAVSSVPTLGDLIDVINPL
ncbi:hypothetical protein COB55_01885 [Candidatus Wolfebacteria bacterium]|nr:MAG: hypothetical protein COB55_01885 [Candidatus Wolfebacteria bacterium]